MERRYLNIYLRGRRIARLAMPALAIPAIAPVGVLAPVGTSEYAGRIKRAIDTDKMTVITGEEEEAPLETWLVVEGTKLCLWGQQVAATELYVVYLLIEAPGYALQNPPSAERITFAHAWDGGEFVEAIPPAVADASLAALPYVGIQIPAWVWGVAGVVAVATIGAIIYATRR